MDAESSGQSITKRFTSYERSSRTGLDYAQNRTYDSKQGRFTQVDPIGIKSSSLIAPQTLNLYTYCINDPINKTDPDGQFWGAIGRFFKKLAHVVWVAIKVVIAVLVTFAAVMSFIHGDIIGGLQGTRLALDLWGDIFHSDTLHKMARMLGVIIDKINPLAKYTSFLGSSDKSPLPSYIKELYKKRLSDCINSVFSKSVAIQKGSKVYQVKGSNLFAYQTSANAPKFDDTSYSAFVLGGGGVSGDAYGRYWAAYKTLFIANDIKPVSGVSSKTNTTVNMSAKEIKQRTYIHEFGNYLAGLATSQSVNGVDLNYFGDPNGVPHDLSPATKSDFDSGANLEQCVFGTQRP